MRKALKIVGVILLVAILAFIFITMMESEKRSRARSVQVKYDICLIYAKTDADKDRCFEIYKVDMGQL